MDRVNVETSGNLFCLAALTFALPTLQYSVNKVVFSSEYAGLASIIVILVTGLWNWKTGSFSICPTSPRWKSICYFLFAVVLSFLLINVPNRPVASITGEARTPSEVFDIIVLLPLAEELVFRGIAWSLLEKLVKAGPRPLFLLFGTSLLFGLEHLGYWAQSVWPLAIGAYSHAISMIFAGVFFGFFRLKSDSIAVPAVLHMLANGAIVLLQ